MIVVASLNEHKLAEVSRLPAALGLELTGIGTLGQPPEVLEDGFTFEENAVLKAVKYSLWLKRELGVDAPVIAEDSGLQIDTLLGWPGIHSARIAPTSEGRIAEVLTRLAGNTDRAARFVAVTALAQNGSLVRTWQGVVRGVIAEEPRGTSGFGYDPIFALPGLGRTFAELTTDEKNLHSHRTQAWTQVLHHVAAVSPKSY